MDFSFKFQLLREWVNNINLSGFQLKNVFKFVLVWLTCKKQNILTLRPCLHTLIQTDLLSNQSAHTILVIL